MRSLGSRITGSGVTHAVNTDYIEDIFLYGDRAKAVPVSGDKFDTTRQEALSISDALRKWSDGASNEVAEMEDAGRSHGKAENDVANLKGGGAG